MFTHILYFIAGCLFTLLIKKSYKKAKESEIKRGLITREYTASGGLGPDQQVSAEIEVAEIESTGTRTKVKFINAITDKSNYNSAGYKDKIKAMVDNGWIPTADIEWIVDSKATARNEKIDKVLR